MRSSLVCLANALRLSCRGVRRSRANRATKDTRAAATRLRHGLLQARVGAAAADHFPTVASGFLYSSCLPRQPRLKLGEVNKPAQDLY